MKTYLAFPVSDQYLEISNSIFHKLKTKSKEPQAEKVINGLNLLLDEIFDQLITKFILQVEINSLSLKTLIQLIRMARKTVNILTAKVVSNLSNKDLYPLVQYIEESQIKFNDEYCFAFPLGEELEKLIESFYKNCKDHNMIEAKKQQKAIILAVSHLAIDLYLVQMMSLLKLGAIGRKTVHTALKAFNKVLPVGVDKMVDEFEDEELIPIGDYLIKFLRKK